MISALSYSKAAGSVAASAVTPVGITVSGKRGIATRRSFSASLRSAICKDCHDEKEQAHQNEWQPRKAAGFGFHSVSSSRVPTRHKVIDND
jgi:hypothetical protein